MPAFVFLASDYNPTIHGAGQTCFGQNHYCTWMTYDGSSSTCVITNPGVHNTLTLTVSGAPDEVYTTDGNPFNGQHVIPPNSPTANVTALGDFKGHQVTIFNMSALETLCQVVTAP